MARWLWLSLTVLVLDQITKVLALAWLPPYQPYQVIANLNLTLMFNEGAAFSVLADAGGWQRWGLSAFAAGMSLVLAIWLSRLRSDERVLAVSLALIIGGAVGNLVDRVLYGHVVDFIQVYLPVIPIALFNPWPAFNIADSAISVGIVLLLFVTLRGDGAARDGSGRA